MPTLVVCLLGEDREVGKSQEDHFLRSSYRARSSSPAWEATCISMMYWQPSWSLQSTINYALLFRCGFRGLNRWQACNFLAGGEAFVGLAGY